MTTRVHGGGGDLSARRAELGDAEIRRFLTDFIRKRVPPSDADDVVQVVLCDALAAPAPPEEREELRKWLIGIARHKVADFHRRTSREVIIETADQEISSVPMEGRAVGSPELTPYESVEARAMVRWAEEQAASTRDAKQTLDWMAREGEGEKLETIAAEENVPAARVRQRVSRLRRWMKERWLAELAAVAAIALFTLLLWRALRGPNDQPEARPEPTPPPPRLEDPSPLERARALRADAFEECTRAEWRPCLDHMNEAAKLDLAGDAASEVQEVRSRANKALDDERARELRQKELEPRKTVPSPLSTTPVLDPTSTERPAPKSAPTNTTRLAPKSPSKSSEPLPSQSKPSKSSKPGPTTPFAERGKDEK